MPRKRRFRRSCLEPSADCKWRRLLAAIAHIEAVAQGAIAQLGERVVRNDEVGGSIPPGSTTLRPLGRRRAGEVRLIPSRIGQKQTRLSVPFDSMGFPV